jgi:cytochrome P450
VAKKQGTFVVFTSDVEIHSTHLATVHSFSCHGDMKIFKQSPTDASFVQNPYPAYDRARAMGDLVWWDDYKMPAAVSYRAVRGLLTNRKFGREALTAPQCPAHLADWQANESHSMLELEPPRHSRLRGLVLRAFTSKKVAAMAPQITETCHRLIDAFPRPAL